MPRTLFLDFFRRAGIEIEASEATFYLWLKAPRAPEGPGGATP